MTFHTLSPGEADSLRTSVCKTWEWSGYYFFPLHPTTRMDVLAFDSNLLEPLLPEDIFQELMESLKSKKISVWREHDPSLVIETSDFEFCYGYSESFAVDSENSWIVYWSHEGTITFGGATLIEKIKSAVPEWQSALCSWASA